jgi:DNA-binding CsgD family transcriptional regulator
VIHRPIVCRRFIGRQDELAYLHERRRKAGASHGAFVLVGGEAGVGKSRLISEFIAPLAKSRWRIAQAACSEFAQRPYAPVLGVLARFDPAAAELAPAASKYEQFEAIAGAFERAAARSAIVAIVEDLHWADVATVELLIHLGGRLNAMRMLVVASFRADEIHSEHHAYAAIAKLSRAPHAGRIDVGPLDAAEQELFIDEALDGIELPDATRRAVARASDGNPFFLEELLKNAVERPAGAAASPRALPATVQASVVERLRPLSEPERRIVAQAAVIGRAFDLAPLAATLDCDVTALLPALRRARDLQLIEELGPTAFRFRHALTRDAIYGGFLTAQLRPLHRKIAQALEDAPDERRSFESLAYHWWGAGDTRRAARYNELAGDAAAAVHAHDDAIAFYERAAEETGVEPGAKGRVIEKAGDRRVALGQYDAAAAAYSAAADLHARAGDADAEAACRVRVALQQYTLGHAQPTAALEAMLERLGETEHLARSRVHLGIAWLAATFYHPSLATHHLDRVDERSFTAAADVAVRYHNVRAWVAMLVGDAPRFRAEHGAWLDAARRAGGVGMVAAAHYNGAYCYALFGAHDEALLNIRAALAIAGEEQTRHVAASAHGMAALCAILRGDLAGARDALDALRALPTDNEVVRAHAMAWGTLAGSHLDDDALIRHWFDRLGGVAPASFADLCGAGCAEILVRRGRRAEAQALLREGIGSGERQRGNVLTVLAVARYGADEDLERARAVLLRAADATGDIVERPAIALFDALVAQRTGCAADAVREAAAAVDGFRRLGFPLLEAAALELAGERDAAAAIFSRCGALHDVRRLDRARPERAPAAPEESSANDEGLSSRERQIALLVARGRPNLEIARELSISHKTVEKHLTSIYQKFGFSTRAQLAAHVSRDRSPGDASQA